MTKKIRFGIIGTNFISEEFIRCSRLCKEIELTSVYSRTKQRGKEFSEKFNIEKIFIDLEEMLTSNSVDAVYIASPNALHAKQTILCLNHKKHVLCEKPLASNQEEVARMIKAAQDNEVLLMEAMILTYLPSLQLIKENLYKIGKVRRYFSSFCQYSSRYDAYRSGTVLNAFKPELSNGALVDIGIYPIAVMVFLFGKPDFAKATGYLLESGVDGAGSVNFTYEEMEANVIYSKIANSYLPSEIQGEEGSIVIDHIQRMDEIKVHYRNGSIEYLKAVQNKPKMFYEIEGFVQGILQNQIETKINTHNFSKEVISLLDDIRQQIGVIYPADEVKNND